MKFGVGENGINLEKNLPRPRFVHLITIIYNIIFILV